MKSVASYAVLILSLLAPAMPGAESSPGAHATGQFQLTFTERSPHSRTETVFKRMGRTNPPTATEIKDATYDPARDPFEVYVPPTYKADGSFGLFVWVGVSEASAEWLPVLARHKLIFVSAKPHDETAPYYVPRRSLDAVHNLTARYKINAKRIFISGFSAGGQIAAFTLHFFPDVFSGGVFLSGDAFHPVYQEKSGRYVCTVRENATWQGSLETIHRDTTIVLMSGGLEGKPDPDGLTLPRAKFSGLVLDGFLRVSCFEIPQLGHSHPNAIWFEKAVTALAQPQTKPPAPDISPTTSPNPLPSQLAQARRLLATARWELEIASSWDRSGAPKREAMRYVQQLLKDYPATPAAAEGRAMLQKYQVPE